MTDPLSTPSLFDTLTAAFPEPEEAPTQALPATRANPWLAIGRRFEPTQNPEQAIIRSGLDWSAEKVGLRTDDLQPVAGHWAVRRSDSHRILGVVGRDYQIVQNQSVFDFFRDLAGEHRITFETAGCFRGGSIVWALAHLPDLGIRIGDDEAKSYLLVSNAHDGSKPLTIGPTTIRVVCQNTLAMAERQIAANRRRRNGLAGGFQVRHTAGIATAIDDIRSAYAATLAAHETTVEAWQALARKPLTRKLERQMLEAVFGAAGPDETDRARALRKAREERIHAILASPTSQVKGTKDSLLSMAHAIVEFLDHDRTTRTDGEVSPQEQRLLSATFGSGAALKARAFEGALDAAALA